MEDPTSYHLAIVGNKEKGIVIGTGDLSELALGWCTYNGDHMSMYAVNIGVPKTLIRHLVNWYMEKEDEKKKLILTDILETPISPELLPPDKDGNIAQKTENSIGSYILHDFFLYHFLRYSNVTSDSFAILVCSVAYLTDAI